MFLEIFPVGPIQANCTLLGDENAGDVVVIDPGGDADQILERLERSGLRVSMVLHTHGHLDHAGGTHDLCAKLESGIPVGLHRDESELYQALPMQGMKYGMVVDLPPAPTLWLEHGQRLTLGEMELEVRHTPGHSPGSVCFVVSGGTENLVIAGDVLFAGSIGRTDLWGGSFPVLEDSIKKHLYSLPDDTRVVCGHGPDTTIGRERTSNPFVRSD